MESRLAAGRVVGLAGASELTFTTTERLRVIFYAGRPLHEPVVAHGPFVMNTEAELQQAYANYRAGQFGLS